jgi:hypothetical protein
LSSHFYTGIRYPYFVIIAYYFSFLPKKSNTLRELPSLKVMVDLRLVEKEAFPFLNDPIAYVTGWARKSLGLGDGKPPLLPASSTELFADRRAFQAEQTILQNFAILTSLSVYICKLSR